MKQFKKRTIALVLASVVTVVGSFAAESYKNSLMALGFERSANGAVNMLVKTKTAFSGNVSPVKKDANTYVLMLPEINSQASTPALDNVSGEIQSVNIRTMPYSANGNGYTRITIKTYPQINLTAKNVVYVPAKEKDTKLLNDSDAHRAQNDYLNENSAPMEDDLLNEQNDPDYISPEEEARLALQETERQIAQEEKRRAEQERRLAEEAAQREAMQRAQAEPVREYSEEPQEQEQAIEEESYLETEQNNNATNEKLMLILSVILIITVCAYLLVRASNKLTEIAGEKISVDVDDDETKLKKAKAKEKSNKDKNLVVIKNKVKSLDAKYSKSNYKPKASVAQNIEQPTQVRAVSEELVVDNMDDLFQEQVKIQDEQAIVSAEEEENQALEDFLSGFFFDEEEEAEPVVEQERFAFDEELYNSVINGDFKFSPVDIECMSKLLSVEINDETFRNINNYLVSNPIKTVPTKQQVLEDIVTTYKISRDISFNNDDIEILNKLIRVEIDDDFITDLRTNPERVKQMEKELSNPKTLKRKTTEALTLSVKDMLPDLSEALKNQNGVVESNYKPKTVYFAEGYDVNILSSKDKLPDLTKEINNKDAYVSKPSASYDLVDNSYEFETLQVDNALPDLEDVMNNPEKYAQPEKEPVEVDEKALLNNIANVNFKPFYDGTQEFEVINDDLEELLKENEIETVESEPKEPETPVNEVLENVEKPVSEKREDRVRAILRDTSKNLRQPRPASLSNDSLKKVQELRAKRQEGLRSRESAKVSANTKPIDLKYVIDGQTYNVISSVELIENKGCHLAKNSDGYAVLAYVDDQVIKLKEYATLKSEKIQARFNEKTSEGASRYIIRIGLNKFIVDVNDTINYVMELC